MDRTTIVLLYLDAFRWDYLTRKDAPFLYSLTEDSIYTPRLKNTAGFTKRTVMLSGAHPDKTKHFTGFAFDPLESPFAVSSLEKHFINMVDLLANQRVRGFGRAQALVRRRLMSIASGRAKNVPNFNKFPLVLWPWFRPTSNRALPYEEGYDVPNLLQTLKRKRYKFSYWLYPAVRGGDEQILNTVIQGIDPSSKLILIQFSDLDHVGHLYGSNSLEYRLCVRKTDLYASILFEEFSKVYDKIIWVILGDHGMTDISQKIDAGSIIHKYATKYGLRHGKHYLLFLDSTLVKIWSLAPKANDFIEQIFFQTEFCSLGKLIDRELASQYHIPYGERIYGDRIWWANPKVLVYPDYFSSSKPFAGMHGYFPDYPDMESFLMIHGSEIKPKRVDKAGLIDICPTLSDLLGINPPSICQGQSLLTIGTR